MRWDHIRLHGQEYNTGHGVLVFPDEICGATWYQLEVQQEPFVHLLLENSLKTEWRGFCSVPVVPTVPLPNQRAAAQVIPHHVSTTALILWTTL